MNFEINIRSFFMKKNTNKKVSIVMGSQSDYKTMQLAEKTLKQLGVSFETKIVSAHRTPKRMYDFALKAEKNNMPMQDGDVLTTYADIDDLVADIGYQPKTSIEEGLKNFINWYLNK